MWHEQGLLAQVLGLLLGLGWGHSQCTGRGLCHCVCESAPTGVHVCTVCSLVAVPVCPPAVCSEWALGGRGKAVEASGVLGAITPVRCCLPLVIHTS